MLTTIGTIKLSKKEWKTVSNLFVAFFVLAFAGIKIVIQLFAFIITGIITVVKCLINIIINVVKWSVNTITNSNNAKRATSSKSNKPISKKKVLHYFPLQDEKSILIYIFSLVIIMAIISSAVTTSNGDKFRNDDKIAISNGEESGDNDNIETNNGEKNRDNDKLESDDEDKYRQFGFDEVDGGYQMRERYKFLNPNYKGELVIPETYNKKPIVEIRGLDSSFGRGITKIVGSKNLVTIKHATFASRDQRAMPNLTEVIFPIDGSLKTIESEAFYWQNSLKTVILPSGIEFIGAGAFDRCYNLQNLVIYNHTPPTIERNIFVYIESSNDSVNTHPHPNFTVFVPDEAVEVYKQSEWGKYNIKPISTADFIEQ